jgi:uncharacterized protein GlcG (DUF336 family)
MLKRALLSSALVVAAVLLMHPHPADAARCSVPQVIVSKVNQDFYEAAARVGGGLFTPKMMWGAIVDRQGRLCTILKTGDAWPGSRAIAIAKASTANDFSNYKHSLSTANLYGVTIPGGSLFGLNNSNPFNANSNDPNLPAEGTVPGGIITFGGGVSLYSGSTVVGGLGVSGDTSCADHDVAYIARGMAIRQHIVSPPPNNDNIVYANPVVPNTFTHPYCLGGEKPPPGDIRAVPQQSENMRYLILRR